MKLDKNYISERLTEFDIENDKFCKYPAQFLNMSNVNNCLKLNHKFF